MSVMTPEEALAEARRRIAEAKATHADILFLGDLPMAELPEFGDMPHLRVLALGNHKPVRKVGGMEWDWELERLCFQGTDLMPLRTLTEITTLDLYGCMEVSSIEPLQALHNLKSLEVSDCRRVSDIEPLRSLHKLESLLLRFTKVSNTQPLRYLKELKSLELRFTEVSDIDPLRSLTNLKSLDLYRCEAVADIEPLRSLTNLKSLNLAGCKNLRRFAPIRPLLPHLEELHVGGCPFEDLDSRLCGKGYGDNVIEAVRAHYADLEKTGADDTLELKVFVLGNGGVGKTQLCRRLQGKPYDPAISSTHGVQLGHTDWLLDGRKVRLNFWDFGGQDIYHGTHSLFVGGPGVFLLLWHPDKESGEDHEAGLTLHRQPFSYWLDYVRGLAGKDMPVLAVQSQCESPATEQELPIPAPKRAEFPYFKSLHFSARTDHGKDVLEAHLKTAIRDLLTRHPAPPIGKNRARVRDLLRAEVEKPVSERRRTLTQAEFKAICDAEGGVASEIELLKYLHNCGVVFHQPGLFENRVIVDQTWALDAIYSLFHRREELQSLLRYSHGRFTRSALAPVWSKYTPAEQELFLGMMVSCGVCFRSQLPSGRHREEDEYRAPEWLPERSEVQDQLLGRLRTTRPTVQVEARFAFLHDGILRTFLSRVGKCTCDAAIYWKYGFWFFDHETHSEVLMESQRGADPTHPGAGVITFQAWGHDKTAESGELVDALLAELRQIPLGLPPEISRPRTPRAPRRQRVEASEPAEAMCATQSAAALEAVRPGPLPAESNTTRQVFVSYAWGLDNTPEGSRREAVVDRLCECLPRYGWEVIRDREKMRNGESIRNFMLRIGRGQRVVVVLSDKYLRSAFCVNEMHLVYQRACGEPAEFARRIVPVTLEDARLSNWRDRANWAELWERERREMEQRLRHMSVPDFHGYQLCTQWQAVIANMLAYIADTLHPVGFDRIVADDFREVREMLDRADPEA